MKKKDELVDMEQQNKPYEISPKKEEAKLHFLSLNYLGSITLIS